MSLATEDKRAYTAYAVFILIVIVLATTGCASRCLAPCYETAIYARTESRPEVKVNGLTDEGNCYLARSKEVVRDMELLRDIVICKVKCQ